jgi:hypothetical protein
VSIDDPYLLLIRVINTGTRNVGPDDFHDEYYTIRLDQEVRSAEVVRKSTEQLDCSLQANGKDIGVGPTLLKHGEWIGIAVVTAGRPRIKSVDLRTPTMAPPKEFRLARPLYARWGVVFPLICSICLLVVVVLPGLFNDLVRWQQLVLTMVPITAIYWGGIWLLNVMGRRHTEQAESLKIF